MRIGAFGGGSLASGADALLTDERLAVSSYAVANMARRFRSNTEYPAEWSPYYLFANGEVGAWYDPSDFSTLYQDSAGTTPVTALGQPVGLVLDKSRGVALQPPMVTLANINFLDGTWISTNATANGAASFTSVAGTLGSIARSFFIPIGAVVRVTVTNAGTDAFRVTQRSVSTGAAPLYVLVPGGQTVTKLFQVVEQPGLRFIADVLGGSVVVGGLSVQVVSGTHAIQPTAASRPTVQARVNLLERTEQFDNAAWTKRAGSVTANAITAPDGTLTADLFVEDTTLDAHRLGGPTQTIVNQSFTVSVYAKPAGRTRFQIATTASRPSVIFDVDTGTVVSTANGSTGTIEHIGDGWYRCTATTGLTPAGNWTGPLFTLVSSGTTTSYTGDGTSGMYFWGAQLELGPTATPYQRVTTATDYADIGLPRYLAFDGFDDSLYTAANLDLSGTDKVTVCAGVTKLSDAAVGVIANLSSAPASNTGTFTLTAPENTTTVRYASAARGSAALGPNLRADITATGTAPDRAVITATHDIAGDLSTIRRNGVAGTNGTADKGTGNFGSYAFFVGRTNNATFPYNGQLNALIVRGTLTDPTTLALAEQWVAGKTGISLP